ncbi:acetyl-CoA carboxylase biotin carboxyl carrier protein subunit [Tamlana sp. I1]|uniref:acetyl-CoA carboxylase biotin carboxyl carrier protein subunit n=1 Tax=Tamlana sp. I1 TaxID=2762061 RepID=UPI00188F48CC|nr:acetyl-CoA carboxylase biotin carboxyl carrier protein subunit [Tamlana sp. I1]
MSEIYTVTVNNGESFEISPNAISKLDLVKTSKKNYHILQNNTAFHAEVAHSDFQNKTYHIKINNQSYRVEIKDDLDVRIKNMGFTSKTTPQIDTIKAPMPGLILEINVKIGQEVKEDTPLLILEAMKMENSIVSPRAGIIKSILIKKSDAVEKGQLLIEFE